MIVSYFIHQFHQSPLKGGGRGLNQGRENQGKQQFYFLNIKLFIKKREKKMKENNGDNKTKIKD